MLHPTVYRVWTGIAHSFPTRYLEWILALTAMMWGARLLAPGDIFVSTDLFQLLAFLPDVWWGWMMIAAGTARVIALAINGTFRDTVYSRYSPFARGITAFFSMMFWLAVAVSAIGSPSQGAIMYPAWFVIEALTTYFVFGESGEILGKYRNGGRNR